VVTGRPVDRQVTAGVASLVVSPPNPERKRLVIINDSDTIVFVNFKDPAVLNIGIRLNAEGGTMIEEDNLPRYECWKGIVCCISTGASKNLCIQES